MTQKVIAHKYSMETVLAFFAKYPPHTELGKQYFEPMQNTTNVLKYHTNLRDFIPEYQMMTQSADGDELSPYLLHVSSNTIYCLPRYGKLLKCEELMKIALEMKEINEHQIKEVPEGCDYWIDWERNYVDIIHPYKTAINELLEIIKSTGIPNTIDVTKYHRYTQLLLEKVASK